MIKRGSRKNVGSRRYAMKEFYSTKDLSDKLGIKPSTIRKWVFDKKIPHYKIGSGKGLLLFKISEIEEWLSRQYIKPHLKLKSNLK
jgi:excisionase family DNA binding protein